MKSLYGVRHFSRSIPPPGDYSAGRSNELYVRRNRRVFFPPLQRVSIILLEFLVSTVEDFAPAASLVQGPEGDYLSPILAFTRILSVLYTIYMYMYLKVVHLYYNLLTSQSWACELFLPRHPRSVFQRGCPGSACCPNLAG